MDIPIGTLPITGAVDAKVEIVWPHENSIGPRSDSPPFAPVERAPKVNVTAMLFKPNTLYSVPTEWSTPVRLWIALDNGVGEMSGVGVKRIVQGSGFSYPVWDFGDIDVAAARNPESKYYFRVTVDSIAQVNSNVWAHGSGPGGTNKPQMDAPTAECQ